MELEALVGRGSAILDEEDGKDHRSTFKEVCKSDANFFATTGIIDYSLLMGLVEDIDI